MTVAARQPRTAQYETLPHQDDAYWSDKRLVFFGGGIGAGKTTLGSLWTTRKVCEAPPGTVGLIAANSYSQLRDSTLRNAYRVWEQLGMRVEPKMLPSAIGPHSIRMHNKRGWIEILCRSLDHYELMAGLELGFFWADEVWSAARESFDMLLGRLRGGRDGFNRQGLVTSTLDDPSHWLYSVFVENYNPDIHEVVYAKTQDNSILLEGAPDFVDQVKASYSSLLVRRMLDAEWISLLGGRIYHAFQRSDSPERAGNVSEAADFDPALPILWTHDFNIGQGKPMSSALCQIRKVNGLPGLCAFDEQILESTDTNDTIEEFKQRRPGLRARIYGDASGKAKDTRSKTTDYEILRAAGFTEQKVPASNPPIRDRHNAVNALLCNAAGQVRLLVHPRCKTLIKGLEVVKLRSGAQYLEEETFEQHVTTALGYLIHQEFPVVSRQVESGNLAIFRRR